MSQVNLLTLCRACTDIWRMPRGSNTPQLCCASSLIPRQLAAGFLIDNWATCDQLSPKVFKKEPEKLLPYIYTWVKSDKVYTVRFAIGMLMRYFLDERFDSEYADMVASIRSEEYYINMMVAWYFATALAKQYDSILPYLEEWKLDDRTRNKAIQKSVESNRITTEQKACLKTLKVRS